jgi:hypothetical protein
VLTMVNKQTASRGRVDVRVGYDAIKNYPTLIFRRRNSSSALYPWCKKLKKTLFQKGKYESHPVFASVHLQVTTFIPSSNLGKHTHFTAIKTDVSTALSLQVVVQELDGA